MENNYNPEYNQQSVYQEQPPIINEEPVYNTYEEPVYAEPVVELKKPSIVMGIISLVCGILSIILNCCCSSLSPLVVIPLGLVSAVLAFIEKKKNGKFSGIGIAGLITGAIGVAFGIFWVLYWIISLLFGITGGLIEGLGAF